METDLDQSAINDMKQASGWMAFVGVTIGLGGLSVLAFGLWALDLIPTLISVGLIVSGVGWLAQGVMCIVYSVALRGAATNGATTNLEGALEKLKFLFIISVAVSILTMIFNLTQFGETY